MKITEYIKQHILLLDGGMGTLLQERGLMPGELPERWNLTHPDAILEIHTSYFDSGSNVINLNTFGANRLKYTSEELDAVIGAAVQLGRRAQEQSRGEQPKWLALDIGPTGRMLKPYGDLDFEDAVEIFAQTVRIGLCHGVDLIMIETMNDSYETKAALLAAKENSTLPVFVSNAYGEDGKLMTGATPAAMTAMLEGMGADAIGVNCSLGPEALGGVVEEYLRCASVPVLLKPNAGLPRAIEGKTVYDVAPESFALSVADLVKKGVRAAGGCCGTTPRYIEALRQACEGITPCPIEKKKETCVSSYAHAVTFGGRPVLIGERINPTGKKRFQEALRQQDMDYILREGLSQEEKGAHILDVNVGLPDVCERELLCRAVCELQAVTALPLQIDTSDPVAMEAALRRYNGKAMINSVNGKRESMDAVFPLAKKYGGLVVALTLDEDGIPARAEERLAIARRIVRRAEEYGLDRKDLIFDPLALTVSADATAARETLRAVELIRRELDCHTSLGVSNVSFGLPARDLVNGTFFAMALERGLSAAILNPYSAEMQKTYAAYCALAGLDPNCSSYIAYASTVPTAATSAAPAVAAGKNGAELSSESPLQHAILKGLREQAALSAREMIQTREPLALVQEEIIPALDAVGAGFERKTVYLPQLLMSAEAAKSAFEVIKDAMAGTQGAHRCGFLLATVKGDIHDIGKNIVKLLLENYGFAVTDLGRDVPPERIAAEAVRLHSPIVGLSALMTTTVPAMEETILLLRKEAPWCRVIVGGAVLNPEYAATIGADYYAKDAMGAVRYAEEIERTL